MLYKFLYTCLLSLNLSPFGTRGDAHQAQINNGAGGLRIELEEHKSRIGKLIDFVLFCFYWIIAISCHSDNCRAVGCRIGGW